MGLIIESACGCSVGKVRANNEDNLLYDGRILEQVNKGLKRAIKSKTSTGKDCCVAIFDGMGGEESGEVASYLAAKTLKECLEKLNIYLVTPHTFLSESCKKMNDEICKAQESLEFGRMGSTLVSLFFTNDEVYVCNIGDSRAFRFRNGELLQLTKDHVESFPIVERSGRTRKPRLTQHLGISPEEMIIEPYIAKGDMQRGDQYLICSDGLTDMLSNVEICATLKEFSNTRSCVDKLIEKALEKGGKDNITVILCRLN